MVAQYSYEATQPEDLEFQAGDVILVLSKGNCASATVGDGRESVRLALRCQTPAAACTNRMLLLQTAVCHLQVENGLSRFASNAKASDQSDKVTGTAGTSTNCRWKPREWTHNLLP